jgi:hypothetical protein
VLTAGRGQRVTTDKLRKLRDTARDQQAELAKLQPLIDGARAAADERAAEIAAQEREAGRLEDAVFRDFAKCVGPCGGGSG